MIKTSTLKKGLGLLSVFVGAVGFSQTTYNFTNCDATGQNGPSTAQVDAEYLGTSLEGGVTQVGGIQYWTVPTTGDYSIDAFGAQGGDAGGLGAHMYGEFSFTAGQEIKILVGQAGETTDGQHGSGGGGTFVAFSVDDGPIIVAGGGGGHGKGSPGISVEAEGSALEAGQSPGISGSPGGVDGGGGAAASGPTGGTADTPGADSPGSTWASGGGGFYTHGGACSAGSVPGGRAFVDGGQGGDTVPGGSGSHSPGGFGGGGGAGDRGAGGGGYSGGGGGHNNNDGGGGGGSFNAGTNQTNLSGINTGHGSVVITLLCNPLTITAPATELCFGDEITLSATSESGEAVTWDGGVTDGVAFAPPVGTTTYTGSTVDEEDCAYSIEIVVNELPEITASSDVTELCVGETVTFTGGGGDTYVWDPADVTDGVAYTPEAGTATYTVTGTEDATGCENTASVDVTVHALPTVTATADDINVCIGNELTLSGEGATTYVWDPATVEDDVAFTPDAIGTTTYAVTGTDDNGCSNEASIEVTVHELPVVTASADEEEICFGATVTFNGGGAETYVWDPADVTDGEPYTPGVSGTTTYTVTGIDANGCENTASVDVDVLDEIVVAATTTDEIAGGDGAIDITVTGGAPGYTFDWDNDGTGDFDDTEDLTDLEGGSYVVVVMDENGCTTEYTVDVTSQLGINSDAIVLAVYPNPTSDNITVKVDGVFDYQLFTMDGKIILNGQGVGNELISLEELAKGTYLLNLTVDGNSKVVKIAKQ